MPAPVISASSSILGFKRHEQFIFNPAATNAPVIWSAVGLPPGVTIETHEALAVTGTQADDKILLAGHTLSNGDRVYFVFLSGGSGLSAGTIYFVRDVASGEFRLASVPGGTAINFSTDISAGSIRKVSGGAISGSCPTGGVYVSTITATNAASESGSREFVFGISSEVSAAADVSATLDALAAEIVLPSGQIRAAGSQEGGGGAQSDGGLWSVKFGDVRLLLVRFVDASGARVDPDPATLRFAIKEFEPETVLVSASSFEKSGDGATAEFLIPIDFSGSALQGALSNYEDDARTAFPGIAEIEWTRSVTFDGSPITLRASTPHFVIDIIRDLVPNA